jgi:single-stranded DNA-binding protein
VESVNVVIISGNVAQIQQGSTATSKAAALSVLIAMDCRNDETIWVRANAYGGIAKKCEDKINKGDYVFIEGELMERKKSDSEITFLEVRIKKIVFEGTLRKNLDKIVSSVKNTISSKI